MSNIIKFGENSTTEPEIENTPDMVLDAAIGIYDDVMTIGYNKAGNIEVHTSSGIELQSQLFFLLEQFKHSLLSGEY